MGLSTQPMNSKSQLFTAQMTGYLSSVHELGIGMRYTKSTGRGRNLDAYVSGGQGSRNLNVGTGFDMEIMSEKINRPRISVKPFMQFERVEKNSFGITGMAPSLRKGLVVFDQEVTPYVALPLGIKLDNLTDEYVYYASMSAGISLPLNMDVNQKMILTLEGNKNLGASSDSVGCLVSWIWK